MASNMTELIHYLVQLEVNKTVAALAAIKNTARNRQFLPRTISAGFGGGNSIFTTDLDVFHEPRRHPRPIAEDFFRAEQISKSDYYAQYEPSVTIPLRNLMALLRSMPNHAADV